MPWQNTILLFVFVIFVLSVGFRTANVKCDLQCVFSFFVLRFVCVRKRERHRSVSNARNSIRRAGSSEEYLKGRENPQDALGIHCEKTNTQGKTPRLRAMNCEWRRTTTHAQRSNRSSRSKRRDRVPGRFPRWSCHQNTEALRLVPGWDSPEKISPTRHSR